MNKTCDVGALLLEDSSSFCAKTDLQVLQSTKQNFCLLFKELFDIRRQQKEAQGEDGEILEYTKPFFNVELPASKVVLPREKPIPKEKIQTNWEKFRVEKGLPGRRKRARKVWDEITKDWVPRYGARSIKKI